MRVRGEGEARLAGEEVTQAVGEAFAAKEVGVVEGRAEPLVRNAAHLCVCICMCMCMCMWLTVPSHSSGMLRTTSPTSRVHVGASMPKACLAWGWGRG